MKTYMNMYMSKEKVEKFTGLQVLLPNFILFNQIKVHNLR